MEADASSWMILFRTVGALALVVALIFAISFVARKYLRPERWSSSAVGGMRIHSTFSLEPKKKLMVVEVEGKKILLGVAESSISFLCALTGEAHQETQKEGLRHVAL